MKTRYILLLAIAAVAAPGMGCGGDDNGGGSATNTAASGDAAPRAGDEGGAGVTPGAGPGDSGEDTSKAAYLERVEAACMRGAVRMFTYLQRPEARREPEARMTQKAIEVSIAPALQEVVDKLEALSGPAADEAKVESYTEALQSGVNALARERASITSLRQLEARLRQSARLAKQYELDNCNYN